MPSFPPTIEKYANRNTHALCGWQSDAHVGSGAFKQVLGGSYYRNENDQERGANAVGENVCKFLHSGKVFDDDPFQADLDAAHHALPVIAAFMKYAHRAFPHFRIDIRMNIPSVWDQSFGDGAGQKFLSEPRIRNFQKFNSNTGHVAPENLVAQALSHFSYHYSDGNTILCDLQGGKSGPSSYVLSDIVVMSRQKGKYGPADLGPAGIETFLHTHRCNQFCCKTWKNWKDARMVIRPQIGTTMQLKGETLATMAKPLQSDYTQRYPCDVLFTQNSIKDTFQDGNTVKQTALALLRHNLHKRDIPVMKIVFFKGAYYCLDNRRLACFRLLQMIGSVGKIKCLLVPKHTVQQEWNRKRDGNTDGKNIRVRGCNWTVGRNQQQTTFPVAELRRDAENVRHDTSKDEMASLAYLSQIPEDSVRESRSWSRARSRSRSRSRSRRRSRSRSRDGRR